MPAQLVIVAAVARNGVIGRNNALPWHLPEDLKRFKALTINHPVIMGRKTWESLPDRFRPLPQRINIVITRNPAFGAEGAIVANSIEQAIASVTDPEVFVIGGAQVYRDALPFATRLELTEVGADVDGDALVSGLCEKPMEGNSKTGAIAKGWLALRLCHLRKTAWSMSPALLPAMPFSSYAVV